MNFPCVACGEFKNPLGMNVDKICLECQRREWIKRRKEYYADKKAKGWKPAYRKKAGAKAYETRVARLILEDPVKYQETLARVEEKDLLKARRIKRKAKKEMLKRRRHYDEDIGKVIF